MTKVEYDALKRRIVLHLQKLGVEPKLATFLADLKAEQMLLRKTLAEVGGILSAWTDKQ